MDDFGDKLNAILNDPAALSRIGELAKSVMGGEAERGEPDPELDPGLISRVTVSYTHLGQAQRHLRRSHRRPR